ncbi:MAG: hypothetical protein U5M51_14435 [Emticicia sp.]|nr:hypothetical protein [Emticicia sp.]
MAKNKEAYQNTFESFASRVKTETVPMPIQKVVPTDVFAKSKEEKVAEVQLNTWIPKDLMKKVKSKGIDLEMNQKELVIVV